MDDGSSSGNKKAMHKDIRRAKLFAIQHLTRRIKMLKNKRGTEHQLEKNLRKATRFEEELEYIKDELDIDVVMTKIKNKDLKDSTMSVVEDIRERAMARLISSKPIQKYLEPSTKTIVKTQGQESSKPENHLPSAEESRAATRRKSISRLTPKRKDLDLFDIKGSSSDQESTMSEVELERTPTSFFLKSLSSIKNHDMTKQNKKHVKQNDETARTKSTNEKMKKKRKKSLNRMGQRARQRLWKEQYGNKAKHVKTGNKMEKSKHDKIKRKVKSSEYRKPMQETRTTQGGCEEEISHPSWEASRRRKLQQNISQTTFQGQKITFGDSE